MQEWTATELKRKVEGKDRKAIYRNADLTKEKGVY